MGIEFYISTECHTVGCGRIVMILLPKTGIPVTVTCGKCQRQFYVVLGGDTDTLNNLV